MNELTDKELASQQVSIVNIREVSPHNKAIYELGKSMLNDSISTGREFCKFMITLSTGAIPVYLSILSFLLPEDYELGFVKSLIATLPGLAFLLCIVVFTIGFFPIMSNFSLDVVDEIEEAREKTIQRRVKLIKLGFSIFVIAILVSIFVIVANLGAR